MSCPSSNTNVQSSHVKDKQNEWVRFSDFENDWIENAFQLQKKDVEVNNNIINFQYLISSDKCDMNEQRPVKREEVEFYYFLRKERFSYPDRALKPFDRTYEQEQNFVWQWRNRNKHIASPGHYNYRIIAQSAIQGILVEGKLLNQEFDAQKMMEILENAKTDEEIFQCVARIYSAESFLYKLINSSLRNHDLSKVDTLGPFCHLLWRHLYLNRNCHQSVLYRGSNLTNEMINEYKDAVGTEINWPAFISTSKNRQVAEFYSGNTLFIISMESSAKERSDISSLSYYPDEEEVLLPQHSTFLIEKVDSDSINEKYFIHLKAAS